MKVLRVSLLPPFVATLSDAAHAGQEPDKDGSQKSGAEPVCDYISAPEQL